MNKQTLVIRSDETVRDPTITLETFIYTPLEYGTKCVSDRIQITLATISEIIENHMFDNFLMVIKQQCRNYDTIFVYRAAGLAKLMHPSPKRVIPIQLGLYINDIQLLYWKESEKEKELATKNVR